MKRPPTGLWDLVHELVSRSDRVPFGLADVGDIASPTFADLDGDGDLDAFIGNYDGNTNFFENVPPPRLVTGVGQSGGPHTRSFLVNSDTGEVNPEASFFAYDPGFPGGVFVGGDRR